MSSRIVTRWQRMTPHQKAIAVASVGASAILGGLALRSLFGRSDRKLPDLIVTEKAAELDAILVAAGLSKSWRRFCLMTAAGESNFQSNAYLGLPQNQPPGTVLSGAWRSIGKSEYEATIGAYNRHADVWSQCPWPKSRYTTAGGLFGFLAPNAVYGYRGTALECIDPWAIYDAVEAVPMFLAICKRIMRNDAFQKKGDWLDLRAGIGSLQRLGDPAARKKMADKMIRQKILARLSIPTWWLYERVEPLEDFDIVKLRAHLMSQFRPVVSLDPSGTQVPAETTA